MIGTHVTNLKDLHFMGKVELKALSAKGEDRLTGTAKCSTRNELKLNCQDLYRYVVALPPKRSWIPGSDGRSVITPGHRKEFM